MPVKMPLRMSLANRGRGLELLVETSQTTVRLSKVPHGVKHIGGGKTVAVATLPDYVGMHIPTGRHIVFDAKESAKNRFPLDLLKEHQRQEILRYGEASPLCIAGLLCLHTPTDSLYWCDWRLLQWPWQQRPASIAWDEMLHIGSAKFAIQWQRFCGPASGARGVEA